MSHGVFFGSNVREARESVGWTRADFLRRLEASGLSMHPTTLARIEDGKQAAKVPEALAMASLLGTTVEALGEVDGFSLKEQVKAAELTLKRKKDAVLHAWEEWVIAGEELLEILFGSGYKMNGDDQAAAHENFRELASFDQMLRDLAAREYGAHFTAELGESYVTQFRRLQNEASLRKGEQEKTELVSTDEIIDEEQNVKESHSRSTGDME